MVLSNSIIFLNITFDQPCEKKIYAHIQPYSFTFFQYYRVLLILADQDGEGFRKHTLPRMMLSQPMVRAESQLFCKDRWVWQDQHGEYQRILSGKANKKKEREGGKKEEKERKKILWFSEGPRKHPGGIITNRRIWLHLWLP